MFRMIARAVSVFVLAGLLFGPGSVHAEPLTVSEKASLQAGMQQHIDRSLVGGSFLHLNPETGAVSTLHPVAAHPMILRMGPHFVLCTDFRDDAGKPVNVDFYMARRGRSYVIFHTAVGQRAQLDALMRAGKVEMAE
ncbi:MAG: hypothetical protein WCJ69_06090 [Betaproteobacteria bacterium]|jgi:hypothetical protein